MCTGGVCPGSLGSAIAFDPDATCGEGTPFSSCPADEVGQCADGVNNDEWTGDIAVDCNDPDCFADPACKGPVGAPLASGTGLALLGAVLFGVGIMARRSRLRARVSERTT
jgi:hypothetical protein